MATMERPRPSTEEASEEETAAAAVSKVPPEAPAPAPVLPSNPEEAVEHLEKRLEGLGGVATPVVVSDAKKEEAPKPAPVAAPAPAAAATAQRQQPAGKNALLARIMAAQEKAKAAEESRKASEAEFTKTKEQVKQEAASAASAATKSAEEAQAEIFKKLSGGGGDAKKEEEATKKAAAGAAPSNPPPPPFEVAEAGMAPPPFSVAEAGMKSDPPPPPFEAAAASMAPPDFGTVESTLKPPPPLSGPPPPSAPTFDPLVEPPAAAPTKDTVDLDFIAEAGIEKVMPPPAEAAAANAAPPTFEQFEATATGTGNATTSTEIDESMFDLDELGNALSPEEKRKMIDEQRAIMAAIEKEAAANKAAIAAAQAENFEQRSGAAAVRAVDDGPSRSAAASRAPAAAAAASSSASASASDGGPATVNIGEGQEVALHGQDKTKKAIADGTALLVQCMNCNNWMQVTGSATLMFCPVCQVVSPVMKQDEVQTTEEARQLDMDHKLAMQLQAEINAEAAAEEQDRRDFSKKQGEEEEGYVSYIMRKLKGEEAPSSNTERLVSGGSTTARAHAAAHGPSWWDTFSEYVSVGVPDGANAPRVGEISVSRPPGAAGGLTSATTGAEIGRARGGEQRGLLASVDGGMVSDTPPMPPAMAGMGSARVAESKPLFSCVMDSVSSAAAAAADTAAAAADTVASYAQGEDESRGQRREGLLSVTDAGRDGGSYHQIG
mmetsp:Transcript_11435/g.24753  ORF Transcript_11435/g.24753 Transcript_11435/m.24753 type:complete len:721 (+) Transcript_11435:294-2456(+)